MKRLQKLRTEFGKFRSEFGLTRMDIQHTIGDNEVADPKHPWHPYYYEDAAERHHMGWVVKLIYVRLRWKWLEIVAAVFEILWHVVRGLLGSAVCHFKGHKIYDDSSAGPDSGNMNHGCSRCGEYWNVPLY